MLGEPGAAYTRDAIARAMRAAFGEDVRFHTCSSQGLSVEELLAFLEARGKIRTERDGFLRPVPANICDD
jgi:probable metal-binding protein